MNSKRVKDNSYALLMELFNYGVANVQPRNILRRFLKIYKNDVIIHDGEIKKIYQNPKRIFPVCVGKASVDMGTTALSILSDFENKVSKGVIVVNKENFKDLEGFECFYSGHPIPDNNGLLAAKYLEQKLVSLNEDDLILLFLSGGGSALLPYPPSNIELSEKINLNRSLLNSGANIKEINTVRKHLSKIKGGNFLRMSFPAKVHSLILSDVIGDDLSSISSGPTVPDQTSFKDVLKILEKYDLWNNISSSIKSYIKRGISDPKLETPNKKDPIFLNSSNTLMGSNSSCLESIFDLCKKKNMFSKIWKNNIEGDVCDLAKGFVRDLKNLKTSKPIILISGGESTVKIRGKGKGGRNQEFALHFIRYIKKFLPDLKFTMLSAGTDGRDGPTNAAGAIVNNKTFDLLKNENIDLDKELNNNNSYEVLKKINSLVIIEGTNTNVADLQLLKIN